MSVRKIIITFPHALGIPGGGTENCIQVARHLGLLGVEIWLLPVMSGDFYGPDRARLSGEILARQAAVEKDLAALGIQVRPVRPHPWHYFLDGLPLRRAVAQIAKANRIDALIGWHQEILFLHGFARRRRIIPAILTAGSYGFIAGRRQFLPLRWLLRWNVARARIVFANSLFTKRMVSWILRAPEEKIALAYCGIDPAFFEAAPDLKAGQPARLFFFGRLTFQKGVFDLLEALGRVDAAGARDWELRVAGSGEVDRARERASALGIADRVHFLGELERDIIIRQLQGADLVILPSYSESFGLAVAESLAAGVPVIAYEAGAVPELVDDGVDGWLVPSGRRDELALAIERVVRDPELARRMGSKGREKIRGRYTWERTAKAILGHLEDLQKDENTTST